MNKLPPSNIIIISFALTILIGSLLLLLPFSTNTDRLSVTDALFTATSATCVTGLITVDTGSRFSFFGQLVILVLIQVGGLGFMTISTFLLMIIGRKITIKDKLVFQESITQFPLNDFTSILKDLIFIVFTFEITGTVLLYLRFKFHYNIENAAWSAVFHSVSAFCNAGFSLYSTSFNKFSGDPVINFSIITLIITGGIGFLVILEIKNIILSNNRKKNIPVLSLHTKAILLTSLILILIGFITIFCIEYNYSFKEKPLLEKIQIALFQSVTPRTAGFNSITTSKLSVTSLFIIIILMFIGGSSGSTAGGIKTGTVFVLFNYIMGKLKGKDIPSIFKRTISKISISRSITIFLLSLIIVTSAVTLLSLSETYNREYTDFLQVLFETVSAFGTVGLSLGLTAKLSQAGKLIIIFTMFIGRLGPLLIAISVFKGREREKFQFAEDNIMVG